MNDKPKLTREEARALVEAGYMPLERYIELYGDEQKPKIVTEPRKRR